VDDCIGAVKWALSTDNEIIKKHVDLTKIIVAGDSAGGYLTSVVSQYFAQSLFFFFKKIFFKFSIFNFKF